MAFQIQIIESFYNPWESLSQFEKQLRHRNKIGACTIFTGTMRDFNEKDEVTTLFLEHYPGMTEGYLEGLLAACAEDNNLGAGLIVHRVGEIKPAETIVLVAAWSAHRREAFKACKQLIEELKHNAPFWKKETLSDNSTRWVESNTPG